jgi:SAM-dependent methyltransferase
MGRADEQRLAFGRVADAYDRARPSYPAEVVDAVVELGGLSPGVAIFEVGAGTGKATVLLAQRGLRILAVEPDREMARIARARVAAYPELEIVESDFERWRPSGRRQAIVSAQAWHWVAEDVRYAKAGEALLPGGKLLAIWTLPDWGRFALRAVFADVYRELVPDMRPDFPMHPDSDPASMAGDWLGEIERAAGFGDPVVLRFPWTERYTSAAYAELVSTHQDHIRLPDDRRSRLLTALEEAVDAAGGELAMPYETRVCAATWAG